MTNEQKAPAALVDRLIDAVAEDAFGGREDQSPDTKSARAELLAALSSPPAAEDAEELRAMNAQLRKEVESLSALVFASPAAPPPDADCWVMVPREPTPEMRKAFHGISLTVDEVMYQSLVFSGKVPGVTTRYAAMEATSQRIFARGYAAALAAAPKPAASVGSSVDDVIELLEEMQTDRTVLLHFSDTAQARIRNGLAALVSYLSGLETVAHRITGDEGEDDALVALQRYAEQREAAHPTPAAPPSVTDAEVSRLRKYYEVTQHRIGLAKMALMRNNPGDASMHLAKLSDEIDEALTHPGHKHAQEDAAREGPKGEPITAAMLADAFGCFWNAAIGSEPVRHDSTAAATVSGVALGMAAIEARLREFAIDSEAK